MSESITFVKNGIHNPKDARHYMRIGEPSYPVTATAGGVELARSTRARKVKEVGFDIYDPVLYFPREDVAMDRLEANSKTTHCPLKGDTVYFDLVLDSGRVENAAWSYVSTIDVAVELKDLVAFDVSRVQVVEHTVQS